jgi:adenylate cyclase
MGADEAATLAQLKSHRKELVEPKAAQYHGRTIKLMGDGTLMEFASVVDAVAFAVEVQCAMQERNADIPEGRRITYRIGINIGDIIVEGDDIYGDGVNIAARLEGLADPGGICISRSVHTQIADKLDLEFEDLGEQQVKNIAKPVMVYRVALDERAAALVTSVTVTPPTTGRGRRPQIAAGLVLSLVAVAGLVWWQPWAPDVEPASVERMTFPLPDKPSIAVLPFANVSDDPEQEYFADGMTDDLITDLSKLSDLFVISRNSAFTYKGKAVNVPDVARELGVRYVLEGSVRREGETVRINAQLIDGTTGGHVWADRYDGTFDGIFTLQDKVIGQIVAELKVKLTNAEQAQLARIPTTNLEARAEQEGYYVADGARYRRTLAFYRRSIELDPEFGDAYAGYARALIEVMRLGFDDVLHGSVARKDAYEAAGRALALDPENARAYSVLAFLQVLDSRHSEAIESARRAVSRSPSDAEAKTNLGLVLAYAGRPAEAVTEVEAALRLNPKPPPGVHIIAGLVLYFDRQYERAITALERARADQPTSELALEFLAASYAHAGDFDTAGTMREMVLESFPAGNLAFYRLRYQHLKRKRDVDHHLEGLEKAGFTPWPFGHQERPENRLPGSAIEALTFGKLWNGTRHTGVPFVQEISETGGFAYSSTVSLTTGSLWIDGDQVCQRVEGYIFSRAVCGYVYRNTDKEREGEHQYVYVAPDSVKFFSVSE